MSDASFGRPAKGRFSTSATTFRFGLQGALDSCLRVVADMYEGTHSRFTRLLFERGSLGETSRAAPDRLLP